MAVVEMLKEEGKIDINEKFIDSLKIIKVEEKHETNIIELRENLQYSTDLEFKEKEEFNRLVEFCKEVIDKTRDIVK